VNEIQVEVKTIPGDNPLETGLLYEFFGLSTDLLNRIEQRIFVYGASDNTGVDYFLTPAEQAASITFRCIARRSLPLMIGAAIINTVSIPANASLNS